MFAIAFRCLRRTNERFRHPHDVVEALGCHSAKQRIDVVLALGADVLAQDRHALGRNRHFGRSPR
jgi:hypothetical protein